MAIINVNEYLNFDTPQSDAPPPLEPLKTDKKRGQIIDVDTYLNFDNQDPDNDEVLDTFTPKKYGKTIAGKMIRKLIKKFRNKKNSKQLDKIIDDIEKGGNESGVAPEPDLDLVQEPARPPVSPKPKPKPGEPGSQYDAKGRKRFIPKVDPLRG